VRVCVSAPSNRGGEKGAGLGRVWVGLGLGGFGFWFGLALLCFFGSRSHPAADALSLPSVLVLFALLPLVGALCLEGEKTTCILVYCLRFGAHTSSWLLLFVFYDPSVTVNSPSCLAQRIFRPEKKTKKPKPSFKSVK
jgi:hypothetical protein